MKLALTLLIPLMTAAPAPAGDKTLIPTTEGVIVADETNEIFMDKRSPEERDADTKETTLTKDGVICDDELNEI